MTDNTRENAKKRLSRISGQVSGLQKMVDDERYCVDILTQLSALRSALDQLGLLLLSQHLETCVYGAHEDGEHHYGTSVERQEEIRLTLNRFLK